MHLPEGENSYFIGRGRVRLFNLGGILHSANDDDRKGYHHLRQQ